MRRLLRIILWMVKGLMLVIALAALVMWPVSRGRAIGGSAQRYTAGPALGEQRWYSASSSDGWAVIGRSRWSAWGGPGLAGIRQEVMYRGDGWRWERWSRADTWNERNWPSRWGPLRWDFRDGNDPVTTTRIRYVSAPFWLMAIVVGAWPLTSIAFVLRRRVKRRRAAREGRCKHCGYDLRATPAAGGALLAVCPECGAACKAADPAGASPAAGN